MFTLRFKRGDYETVISAVEYEKDVRGDADFAFVIANGVERQVGGVAPASKPTFAVCFVENQSGKTIDRIGPFARIEEAPAS